MFIFKAALPRRTVLRGMGATLALPLLEAMVPALTATAKTAANPPKRFGAVFVPLGERPGFWTPATVGSNFEFTPILKPVEKFREHVTVVSELCDPLDGHATTVSAWSSARGTNTTPVRRMLRAERARRVTPTHAATRPRRFGTLSARWTTVGVNPAAGSRGRTWRARAAMSRAG